MDLSIIIINWNSRDYVRACLRSIYAEPVPFSMEVIVFDSGSKDGCAEMAREEFPQVRYFESDDNLGFARANNAAVASAGGDALLFLNPDTEVRRGALGSMYEVLAAHPDAGAVGARLLNSDGTLQTSCVQAFPTVLNQMLTSNFGIRLFPHSTLWGRSAIFRASEQPQEVEAISGAAIMMRRVVFEKVGRFCEAYFMYSEDIDLCFQTRRAGYRNLYTSAAEIVHHGGGSSSQQPSRFSCTMKAEAMRTYMLRNRSAGAAVLYRAGIALSSALRIALLVPRYAIAMSARSRADAANAWLRSRYVLGWALGLHQDRRST